MPDIKTVGAIINIDGKFAFMFRKEKKTKYLTIVRLGGHIEENESAVKALRRELMEEANLKVSIISAPIQLERKHWYAKSFRRREKRIAGKVPLLVKGWGRDNPSLIYLCYGHERPKPDHETYGIVLLRPEDVKQLCKGPMLIREFLLRGGDLIPNGEIDDLQVLAAGPHVHFLQDLLDNEKDLMNKFMKRQL